MAKLIQPHGATELKPLLLEGAERDGELNRANALPQVRMTSRETSDLIMLGIGAFTPLEGFMGKADWQGVCDDMQTSTGLFWPIPITLSATREVADGVTEGSDVALIDDESGEVMGTMTVQEKYEIDKAHECAKIFGTEDAAQRRRHSRVT